METKDVIQELRNKAGVSQEELAEKVHVTRQAVSRWENGDTIPNTETLKLLSKVFDVSTSRVVISLPKSSLLCFEILSKSRTSTSFDTPFFAASIYLPSTNKVALSLVMKRYPRED